MAHVRQDTLTRPADWCKHLRPFGKRLQAKKERKASVKEMEKDHGEDHKQAAE